MSSNISENKPVIGISCGDINGIGLEIIIKTIGDARMLEICTPVIFASNKVLNFYRKALPDINFNFSSIKDATRINHKQVNLYNCWEEEVPINPGILNETGGKVCRTQLCRLLHRRSGKGKSTDLLLHRFTKKIRSRRLSILPVIRLI
jgi:4-hydroxythreonine-4-phosphate dehydrogenase